MQCSVVSRQIFITVPNIEFHRNPSSFSRADTRTQTEGRKNGYDEAKKSFCDHANASKNKTVFLQSTARNVRYMEGI